MVLRRSECGPRTGRGSFGTLPTMPAATHPATVAVVGATASGKTGLSLDLARAAGRRGGQHRRHAGLPRHGRRHGQAATRPSAGASPTTCSTCSTSPRRRRSREFQGWARDGDRRHPRPGRDPGAGGRQSALYTRAILDRFEFPGTDESVRRELEADLERARAPGLHDRLARLDPEAADRILADNGRRVVRALEVIALTGRPYSASLPQLEYADPLTLQVGVDIDRPALDARIDERVRRMYDEGLVDEVERLLDLGLERGLHRRPGDRLPRGGGVPARGDGPRRRDRAHPGRHPALRPPPGRVVPQGPARRLGLLRRPATGSSARSRPSWPLPLEGSTTGRLRRKV